jgi:hypothetical protein
MRGSWKSYGAKAGGRHSDGGAMMRLVALAIVLAALLMAWLFRYEPIGDGTVHRNRITGHYCTFMEDCWFWSRQPSGYR